MKRGECEIILEKGAETNGLAQILKDLLEQNCLTDEDCKQVLASLSLDVGVRAGQGNEVVECTLSFLGGRVRIYPELKERCDIVVEGTFDSILDLSRVPHFRSIPLLWTKVPLQLGLRIVKRELVLKKILFHPLAALKLLRILTVEKRNCPFTLT